MTCQANEYWIRNSLLPILLPEIETMVRRVVREEIERNAAKHGNDDDFVGMVFFA